jgi:hypothetical protein
MRMDVTRAQQYAHVVLNKLEQVNASALTDGVDNIAKSQNVYMDV